MKKTTRFAVILAIAAVLTAVLTAVEARSQQFDASLFKGMTYRSIGPFRGGRVLAVAGVPGDPNTYYFGAVAGGVWKSTNGGVTWTPLFDTQPIASIGSIAVAPSDHNVIYAGTGEACIRGDISYGDGVYKSLDGGKTWTNVGLKDTRHIGKVIVDPHNPDIVFVAALGHAYGPNTERGIFRSTDGGKTWDKVLYKDDKTGGIDVTFDGANPHVLFASLWEAYRTPWSLSSGGPGSGLYKSSDGGTTWKRLESNGLPKGILGRIGIAVSAANPDCIYAQIEAEQGGLYRSNDAGDKWTLVNADHRFLQRAWYYMHVFADPQSPDTVYELNVGAFRSTDGGKTFAVLSVPHGDNHALWIDPTNPHRLIEGNDGGATISVDGGKSWTNQLNQPTAQFYHVIADNRFPYYVYGAQQDNTTVAIASRSNTAVIDRPDWYPVGGGESGYIAPDPRDPNIVYAGGYEGEITRFDKRTGQAREISPWPEVSDGTGAAHLKYRFQWTEPILISPHDPNVLYYAANVLFKSTDGGTTWTAISPDLTRNDKSKQGVSGGPITKDDTGTEYYDTIFAVAESPLERGLLWAGSDDGLVHLTRDDGQHWSDVTPKDVPAWSMVSLIDPSPHNAGAALMAVDRHKLDDFKPYIYKTTDYGKSWTTISTGIPDGAFVHAVREDPKRPGLLYAGTETGVYVSFDDGSHWQPLQLNLPRAPVHDLIVKNDDLVVATHGRSFWILDDLTPLRQLSRDIASAGAHLYTPELAYRVRGPRPPKEVVHAGLNPPQGAIIDYYLRSGVPANNKDNQEITLEILDSQGKLVRKFSNLKKKVEEQALPEESPEEAESKAPEILPAEAGLNRFVWDLRYDPPREVPGMMAVFSDYKPRGPLASPGKYEVRLTVVGKSQTAPLEIKLDPRVSVSEADLAKQLELGLKIRDAVNQAHDTINQMEDVRKQLLSLRHNLAAEPKDQVLITTAESLDKKMTAVEDNLIQRKIKASEDSCNYPVKLHYKLVAVGQVVDSADAAPTAASYEEFETLSRQLESELAQWHGVVTDDLAALNDLARKQNVAAVMVPSAQAAEEAAPAAGSSQ
ncbi:MAG TPA: glycosyl hydrolase [Terriglobia bacterium]|nr:glycosyl hydrolase [Terriglobia bacterium]